jgi:hypothetical protein
MTMTVGELIGQLQDLDPDTEVRIASQPHWPFEYSISAVSTNDPAYFVTYYDNGWFVVDDNEDSQDNEHFVAGPFEDSGLAEVRMNEIISSKETIVYLAEGTQLGYLPIEARHAVGW